MCWYCPLVMSRSTQPTEALLIATITSRGEIELGPTQARWVPVAVQIAPQSARALGAGAHPMRFRIALVKAGRAGAELSERSTFVVPR